MSPGHARGRIQLYGRKVEWTGHLCQMEQEAPRRSFVVLAKAGWVAMRWGRGAAALRTGS